MKQTEKTWETGYSCDPTFHTKWSEDKDVMNVRLPTTHPIAVVVVWGGEGHTLFDTTLLWAGVTRIPPLFVRIPRSVLIGSGHFIR